jgi:AcrR family transcriptional regulator
MTGRQAKRVVPEDGREQRAHRTRAAIRRAAGELIVAKGLQNTTVDEIAAAAGISKGTFYLHFKSKDDLVLEYAYRRLRHVQSLLPEILLMGSVRESLHEIVTVVVKNKDWHPAIVKVVLLQIAESYERLHPHDLRELLLPLIELGVGRGELRRDIPAPILASFVADTIYCGLRNWGMGLGDEDLDRAIEHAVTLACEAIVRRVDEPAGGDA